MFLGIDEKYETLSIHATSGIQHVDSINFFEELEKIIMQKG